MANTWGNPSEERFPACLSPAGKRQSSPFQKLFGRLALRANPFLLFLLASHFLSRRTLAPEAVPRPRSARAEAKHALGMLDQIDQLWVDRDRQGQDIESNPGWATRAKEYY